MSDDAQNLVNQTYTSPEDPIQDDSPERLSAFSSLLEKYRYTGGRSNAAKAQSPSKNMSFLKEGRTPTAGRSTTSDIDLRSLAPRQSPRSSPRKRARADGDASSSAKDTQLASNSTATSAPSSPTASSRKRQKIRQKRGYAPPETYEHLRVLQDYLQPNLDVVFCGINPGYRSAEMGHHFGHATNHFWRCLHLGGFTERQLSPTEDHTLPDIYNLGITNLTDRPSKEAAELSTTEQKASIGPFLLKIARHRPRVVCFVGMNIWDLVKDYIQDVLPLPDTPSPSSSPTESSTKVKPISESQRRRKFKAEIAERCGKSKPGLKPFKLVYDEGEDGQESSSPRQTLFWSLPSTSARVVNFQLVDKAALSKEAKEFVGRLNEPETAREVNTFYALRASSVIM
ncbi:uracil-DNA glycosylase-like protein [Pterulicium gracile]|uniref:Uracil-DNA glycosylase-like protein n=1 Tax=Pterulicium gracile TaxID=1884261 RepID=A0A5C3QR25_9AGAR|nr:uracil-DNA glycosylase-like protein [Pterula gracilis]